MSLAIKNTFEKVRLMGFWYTFFRGHISIGPLTIFGANAMNWCLCIYGTPWGNLHIDLPVLARWRENRAGQRIYTWCLYASPNGTPWACTWYRGSDKYEVIRARIRKLNFGHNFSTKKHMEALRTLNNKHAWFHIGDYDIDQFGPKEEKD